MYSYLFRQRGGANGIPFPSSAHYRLWIQPRWRREAGPGTSQLAHEGARNDCQPIRNTCVTAGR